MAETYELYADELAALKESVARGAKLLDERRADDWRAKLRENAERLNMMNCWDCTLGILYGNPVGEHTGTMGYSIGKKALFGVYYRTGESSSEYHGFNVTDAFLESHDEDEVGSTPRRSFRRLLHGAACGVAEDRPRNFARQRRRVQR